MKRIALAVAAVLTLLAFTAPADAHQTQAPSMRDTGWCPIDC